MNRSPLIIFAIIALAFAIVAVSALGAYILRMRGELEQSAVLSLSLIHI